MMGAEHHFTMLLPGGSFCLRATALGGGSPWAFPFGRGFWPRDGDLLVDLVVDLVRSRNIKPTLGERMEPSSEFEGGNLLG